VWFPCRSMSINRCSSYDYADGDHDGDGDSDADADADGSLLVPS